MAPKAAAAPVSTPSAETGTASDDSVSPPAPDSVHGRQKQFMQAIEEASTELKDDVFPYGLSLPFKVRDAVPGNKMASAKVFLSEAPKEALKDMCLFLQLDEDGDLDDLVSRLLDYFTQLFPKAGSSSARSLVQEKLATGPTPARARTQGSGAAASKALTAESSVSDIKDRLTELGKPVYGSKDALLKRLQEAEAESAKQSAADKKKRPSKVSDEDQKDSKASETTENLKRLKKQKTTEVKSTENLQTDYCVPGLSIAAQMKMAMKLSMEG